MIACYDLARCPPTYDVVAFLALAELERKRRGDDTLDIRISPGPVGGFRRDSLWPHDIESRIRMRDNVLIPLCGLLPSVRSIDVGRADSAWGAGQYFVGLPRIVEALRAGSRPLRAPSITKPDPHLITFTLREASHHPLRNSRTDEWVQAARTLRHHGYKVVVIRDTACAYDELPDCLTAPSASVQLEHRAALYAQARLNVGISNGPMWMAVFMDVPVLMLRPTTNEAQGCYDDNFYARQGIRRGDQLPASPAHQRLVWEEDYAGNIVAAVNQFISTEEPS